MAASAQQNIDWLNTTSVQLQEAAAKATASAAAYEAAFSATIPPPVCLANRAQLAALVATNILGQNTPAIAANEAMYGEFWAQDATALTTYAANAAAAAQVTPLTEPTQATNPGGTGAQAAAVSNAVNSNASNSSLNGCSAACRARRVRLPPPRRAPAATPLDSLYNAVQGFFGVGAVQDTINTINVTGSWFLFIGMSAIPLLRTSLPVRRLVSRWATPRRSARDWASAQRWRARLRCRRRRRWRLWVQRPRSAGCRCRPAGLPALPGRRGRDHVGGNGLDRIRRRGSHWYGRWRHERCHAGHGFGRRQGRYGHRRAALRRQAEVMPKQVFV